MKFYTFLVAAGALLLTLASCNPFEDLEDIERAPYEAEFALPLVDTRFSMGDLLQNFEENSTLTVDPDGLIRFKYRGDVITKSSNEVFDAINETLSQFPAIPLIINPTPLPFSQPDELEIDRLDIKSGNFFYNIDNQTGETLTVTITIPQATKDGVPLEVVEVVEPGTVINNNDNAFSLAGYRLLPENESIFVTYTSKKEDGSDLNPTLMFISFSDLEFTYAEGYLGNQVYEGGRDTIDIDFFDNWIRGEVYFEDPTITFDFINSFGIPTRSVVNVFDIFTVREEVLPLESDFISQGIDFPYPGLDEVGEVKSKQFVFTKDNSNIDIVLGAGPVAIDYDVNALTNPDAMTEIRGFITDSSFYAVQVEVELPMYGWATQFVVTDTFELELGDFDDAKYAEFKLVAENGLPLNVETQAYFLGEDGTVIDSLLAAPERLVVGAPVDADGNVTGITLKETYVAYDELRFDRLRQAKQLLVNAAFYTTTEGEQSVRILNEQGIDVRIGMRVGVVNE